MPDPVMPQLIILLVLLLLSAFFSSAETALTMLSKLRIRSMVEENVKGAKTVSRLIEEPSKMLSTILVGNNIVNLSASALTTSLTIDMSSSYAVGIATGILTLLILVFGEVTPKTLATIHAEKLAFTYAPIIYALTKLLTPITYLVNRFSYLILLILRTDPSKRAAVITENELRTIVDVSHEEGVIEREEHQMINNVVDFGDSLAKDIMVPRIDMSFANTTMTYQELLDAFRSEQYSRMPVYSETRDNIIGMIYLKDVFFHYEEGKAFDITKLMRSPYFTYEYKKTSELLHEMQKNHISIAIVLDEYGATAGLITLEDLLEEIVGEIRDEYDNDEEDLIQKLSDTEYIADGTAKLDDINDVLGLSLDSDDYDSVAGHIIHLLNHLPLAGEQITEGDITYTVTTMVKNRIDRVHINVNPKSAENESAVS